MQTCVALLLALGMHVDLDSAAEGAYTNMGFQLLNVHIQRWCMHNQQQVKVCMPIAHQRHTSLQGDVCCLHLHSNSS